MGRARHRPPGRRAAHGRERRPDPPVRPHGHDQQQPCPVRLGRRPPAPPPDRRANHPHRRVCRLGARLYPGLAVVAISGKGFADHDDQAGVGIDDDLVVGGVPVVLRLLRDGMITGGYESAVDDQDGVLGEASSLSEREQRADMIDDAVGRGLGYTEQRRELAQRQVCSPVGHDQEHPILKRQPPRPAWPHRVRVVAAQHRDELAEVARAQPTERGYPRRYRRRDHTSYRKIISSATSS